MNMPSLRDSSLIESFSFYQYLVPAGTGINILSANFLSIVIPVFSEGQTSYDAIIHQFGFTLGHIHCPILSVVCVR